MQKTIFFLFFICGWFIHSSAIDLIGTVKDKSTGEPLPYATVARMDG